MKKIPLRRAGIVITVLILLAVVIAFTVVVQKNASRAPRLTIAATIFPVYDIARTIAGDTVDVRLLSSPGLALEGQHLYDKDDARDADIIFAIGHGLDDKAIPESVRERVRVVDDNVDLMLEEGSTASPYYWLSIRQSAFIVSTITQELMARDPEHADDYAIRASALVQTMQQIDQTIVQLFASAPSVVMAVYGYDWSYFARDYGLTITAYAPADSESNEGSSEPTTLGLMARDAGAVALFSDITLDPTPLIPALAQGDLALFNLDIFGGVEERMSYPLLMSYNARQIFDGLSSR